MAPTPRQFLKEVALDPGVVYSVADCLLFAKTNPLGFAACLAATGVSVGLRTVSVFEPRFLHKKYPKLLKMADDERTPLRASGLALLVVGGAAIATGAALPAATSMLMAVANFQMAESIAQAARDPEGVKRRLEEEKKKPFLSRITSLSLKRPDLYLNAGFACAGLMAGGAALFILPVVAVSFGVSMRNIMQNKPEHAGHPKTITAGAGVIFSGIGIVSGHGLIAAAHALNASVVADAGRRITPGGTEQIVKDVKGGVQTVLGMNPDGTPSLPPPAPAPQAPEPAEIAPKPSRLPAFSLARLFGRNAEKPIVLPAPANDITAPKPQPERKSAPKV